jgi:hypothetical protein
MGVMKRIAGGAKGHPLLKTRPEPGFRICPQCNGLGCDPCLYTGWGELHPLALERAQAEYPAQRAARGLPPVDATPPPPSLPKTESQLTFGW